VQHSLANLKRKAALDAKTPLEKEKLRQEAKAILSNGGREDDQPFTSYTRCQIIVDELEDLLASPVPVGGVTHERTITEKIKSFEQAKIVALQKFPQSEQFALLEARFHEVLDRAAEAERALERAFRGNPRSEYVASRLADRYRRAKRLNDAKEILRQCLNANPSARVAHYKLALLLMETGEPSERPLVLEHLRKSFTDGDSNVVAQFWYARELFVGGRFAEASSLFARLWDTRMEPRLRNEVKGVSTDTNGRPIRYRGRLVKLEESFAFIRFPEIPDDLFADKRDSDIAAWESLYRQSHIEGEIAFSMRGPRVMRVVIVA
jgi:tetratricopeptide (TPR) repeat protein